jgi:hypothetical protein
VCERSRVAHAAQARSMAMVLIGPIMSMLRAVRLRGGCSRWC